MRRCAKNKDQKTELIEYWNILLENLPRVSLPPLLADSDANAQAAAAEGNTFIELKDAKKWLWAHKPESGESVHCAETDSLNFCGDVS